MVLTAYFIHELEMGKGYLLNILSRVIRTASNFLESGIFMGIDGNGFVEGYSESNVRTCFCIFLSTLNMLTTVLVIYAAFVGIFKKK